MYERRQRGGLRGAGAALGTGLAAFGILAIGACTPVSPTSSGAPGPTATPLPPAAGALSEARTAVTGAATALPIAQGTLQAAATAVSPQVQYVMQILATILGGGVQVQLEQQPPDAASSSQVTTVHLRATDATGVFAGLDRAGREKTAEAVLLATSQFYPQATVDLLIVDGANRTLMTASRAPGEAPKLDD